MRKNLRKFALNKETVRQLDDRSLAAVAGMSSPLKCVPTIIDPSCRVCGQ